MSKSLLLKFLLPLALLLPCAAFAQAPVITVQPVPQVATPGGGATFTVTATGATSYRWQKNSVDLADAASHIAGSGTLTLTFTNIVSGDYDTYQVVVTNASGSVTSNPVALASLTANAATDITTSGFTFSWNAVAGATSYVIDVATNRSFGATYLVTGFAALDVGNTLTASVTGLTENTTYFYRVRPSGFGGNAALLPARTASTSAALGGVVFDEAFTNTTAATNADLLSNLNNTGDPNSYLRPTSNHAAWYTGGTTNLNAYIPNWLFAISAGASRGYLAYFQPSTSVVSLAVGDVITARLRFKLTDGTPVSTAGNFRVALLNSNGNGSNFNVTGSDNATNPARLPVGGSLSVTSNVQARGYSGYIVETTVAPTAPAANSVSFWRRVQATYLNDSLATPAGLTKGTGQWAGPAISSTPGNLQAVYTAAQATNPVPVLNFDPVGATGGTAAAVPSDGRDYVLDLSVRYDSSTQLTLTYTLKSGATTIQSHTATQTTGTLTTAFDTLFIFNNTNAIQSILGLTIGKESPPTTPTATAATSIDSAGFTANWTTVSGATSYRLDVSTDSGFGSFVTGYQDLNVGNVLTKAITGLSASTPYFYRVRAANGAGTSTSSGNISATTAPLAPTASAATSLTASGFTANWSSVTGATGYRLDVATDSGFTAFVSGYNNLDAGNVTSLAVTGLSSVTTYHYRVRAYNSAIVGASSSVITLDTPPVAPSTASGATALTGTSFTAQWGAVSGATGYKLDVSTDSGFGTFVGSFQNLDVNALSAAVTGLAGNTTYYYRVRAATGSTPSASSTTAQALTLPVITAPPGSQSVLSGSSPTFTVVTNNPTGLSYQWKRDTSDISGATTATLALTNVQAADSGASFTVVVTNATGSVTSSAAVLTVTVTVIAPAITTPPATQSVAQGAGVTFSVTASGTAPFTYQWQKKPAVGSFTDIPSATAGTLTLSNVQPADAAEYRVTLTNSSGSATSAAATLTVITPPSAPTATAATALSTSGFTANWNSAATATGYRLDVSTSDSFASFVSGYENFDAGTALTKVITGLAENTTYYYRVRASNEAGTSSSSAPITVTTLLALPTITAQPQPQTVQLGANTTLSVTATHASTAALSYQWKRDGSTLSNSSGHIAGATGATLTLTDALQTDAGSYTVGVTNATGTTTSAAATVTVTFPPPAIADANQPKSQKAFAGSLATFSVVATGTSPFTYQWKKGSTAITGATSATLTLTNLTSADAASYSVVVTNVGGSTTSTAASLTVDTLPANTTLPTLPSIPSARFSILDYGASPSSTGANPADVRSASALGGTTRRTLAADNTAAIQAAINAAIAAGGGTVVIPAAATPYVSGPLTLASKINLQIEGGAILRAKPMSSYGSASTHFITVPSGSADVALTGAGTIEGDGTDWWTADANTSGGITRPRLVQFTAASRVLVSGITVQNSPQFHIAFSGANTDVTVSGVTITATAASPNTDGIDYAGKNLLIQNCSIAVGDDNIAIKPGSVKCENLTIAHCTFGTGHGLSVGGQTNAGLDGMTVTDCTFDGTVSGLRLKADVTQGGPVANLTYTGITMTNVQYPVVFYSYYNEIGNPGTTSSSNGITPAKVNTRNAAALGGSAIPTWKNITIDNLRSTRTTGALGYSIIWGLPLPDALISGVTLRDVSISDSSGFKIYNATNVQFTGTTTPDTLGGLTTGNTVIVTSQPLAASVALPTPAATLTVAAADAATFTFSATGATGIGSTTPTYQWKRNGTALANGLQANGTVAAGATTAELKLTNTHPGDSGDYTCTVANNLDGYTTTGSAFAAYVLPVATTTTSAATLTVTGDGTVPVIATQPASVAVRVGDAATFTVLATSDTPLTYQWKRGSTLLTDSTALAGAQSATLTIRSPQSTDAGSYSVVVTNGAGVTTSNAATLTVNVLPVFTQVPASQSVYVGANVTFTSTVSGTAPFSYSWKKDGVLLTNGGRIAGATSATLTITGAQLTDAGSYSVTVLNPGGLAEAAAATLAVAPVPTAPPAPLANAATNLDSTAFIASWNSAVSAAGYLLDVSTSSSFATFVSGYQALDVGTNLSRAVAGLKPLTNYYFRVRAYNVVGSSPNSATISLTTLDTSFAPKFTSAAGTTFTVGLASRFTVTVTGKPVPTVTATGLPSWVAFNATTGLLTGIAPVGTASGQFAINFAATNTVAPDASQVFTLTVQAPPAVTTPMSITTFAGTAGTSGSTNDTGAAARFNSPSDVAVDSSGRVYVADTDNHVLRQISTAGVVTGQAGLAGSIGSTNGAAGTARFNTPAGVAEDPQGNTFVADTLNHTIRKITSGGTVSLVAGSAGTSGSADGTGSAARFFAPQGLAVAPNGSDLYVADTNNHTLRRIDLLTGAVTTLAGLAGQAGSADGTGNGARFNAPSDVTVDQAGNLYVADTENNTIRTVTAAGAVSTLAGLPGSSGAADGTASSARFNHPSAVVVDAAFNVFVLDTDNHTIRKIVSAAGVVTTVAGQAGTPGSADGAGAAARFNFPTGLALAAPDTFYIADTNNHTLRRGVFSNAPVIVTQPQGTAVTSGATVQLFVTATGQPAPTYQWRFNGTAVAGAATDSLTLSAAQPSQSGKYSVTVTNASGSVTSNEATVTITAPVVSGGGSSGGGGGGGGGGAPSPWFYLALLVLATGRLFASRRASKNLSSSSAS